MLLALLAATACTAAHEASGRRSERNAWTVPGVLRMAGRQEPENLNPLLGTQTIDIDLSMFWAGYLFNWSDRNALVPELASRVPTLENGDIAQNGLAITYHLRRNVRWQDAAPFDAADVIYTWQQMLNPRNLVVSRVGYDLVTRIDERDPYTIVVHLKHPFAPFVNTFFTMANHSNCILPKHLLARYADINRAPFNSLPIGTGPFRIASYERGSRIAFVANDGYWRGPPKLRRIEYQIVPSDDAILTLLRSHAIDFYFRAAETLAPSVRAIPGTRIVLAPFFRFADLGLNAGVPALADRRVRQGLAFATDKAALVAKVTHGVALSGNTDQPPWSWAYDAHAASQAYDPKHAAALLESAGWSVGADGMRRKNGVPLRLTLVGFTGSNTAASAEVQVQSQWRKAGVDVTVKNFSSAQLYATLGMGGIEQSGKFDVAFENWAGGTDPDDALLYRCAMAPPAGWNIYHLCNRALDAAEQTALSHYDRATRRAAYATIQRIAATEVPFIVLWYQREFDVVNSDLSGYRPASAVTPFWNTWEWSM
ncbi:MAG: peptide ABC transporter substrate-binding protein [Candidatus Eremiobacteraeota bacterium]|nr:peptide ABC transporter substrate-binding protein [Candidatus Eremiobacteraeota bacterium]MBC5803753.1 peptide ABC transporter substrate-binding protein [Candidatus Eremiobacteraeota bacterium]MBC5822997.1 peptide ABC transporter substrate-binding protein [Candidatus Eremiobacteraeota bacterium]